MIIRKSKVTFITNQPFSSDVFNDYYGSIAGEKTLSPFNIFKVSDGSHGSKIIVNKGIFVDHRGIKFDLSVGEPLSVEVTNEYFYYALSVFYDKKKVLNYDVELKAKGFNSLGAALEYRAGEQECVFAIFNMRTNKVAHTLTELGKEYVKALEEFEERVKEIIQEEVGDFTDDQEQLEGGVQKVQENLKKLDERIQSELDDILLKLDRLPISMYKTSKDGDTFTVVEKRDQNGKPLIKSVLSQKNSSGQFTRRTVTVNMGTKFENTYTLELKYDSDGDLISEVQI